MSASPPRSWPRFIAAQVVLVALAVAVFAGILWLGVDLESASAPRVAAPPPALARLPDVLPALLAVLVVLLLTTRLFALLARRVGQPAVVGEILAGVVLGPSLVGRLWPEVSAWLLTPTLPVLSRLADLGVILFLFLVGLEFDPAPIRGRGRTTVAVSVSGTAAPFLLGAGLALFLYGRHGGEGVPFPVFALFLGTALSVTAFPVLARILGDLGLTRAPLGVLALTSAAVADVLAWCLLALVVGVVDGDLGSVWITLGLTVAYVAAMLLIVRPVLHRVATHVPPARPGDFGTILALALASALCTDLIGIHPLFGAFLLGAVIPHDSVLAKQIRHRMETVVAGLLLPVFLAWSGLRTQVGLLDSADAWGVCCAIAAVAFLGKMGGTWLAGVATGLPRREAAALGVLMNTRGLVELVVLNVGLDLGVISPTLFTMLVLMAIATTLATTPLLRRVMRRSVALPAAP